MLRDISAFRDPQGTKTDAELISALQRAWLLPREGKDAAAETKFGLDAIVSDEGFCFIVMLTHDIHNALSFRLQFQCRRKAVTCFMSRACKK